MSVFPNSGLTSLANIWFDVMEQKFPVELYKQSNAAFTATTIAHIKLQAGTEPGPHCVKAYTVYLVEA